MLRASRGHFPSVPFTVVSPSSNSCLYTLTKFLDRRSAAFSFGKSFSSYQLTVPDLGASPRADMASIAAEKCMRRKKQKGKKIQSRKPSCRNGGTELSPSGKDVELPAEAVFLIIFTLKRLSLPQVQCAATQHGFWKKSVFSRMIRIESKAFQSQNELEKQHFFLQERYLNWAEGGIEELLWQREELCPQVYGEVKEAGTDRWPLVESTAKP